MNQILFAPNAITAAIDWTETSTVVIAGIVIVLLMLIALIFVFYIFGAIVSSLVNKSSKSSKKEKKAKGQQNVSETSTEQDTATQNIIENAIDNNDSNELIAVISAAIAAEGEDNFTIKSIRRKKDKDTRQRNAWALAAVHHNTKSF